MPTTYFEEKTFEKLDFSENFLTKGEYERCVFVSCNFSEVDLDNISFIECEFKGCNLSLAKMTKTTAIRDAKFKDCKILGVQFSNCNEFLFSVDFDNCTLNLSSFYKQKLKSTRFKNTSLHEVDFTESDLSIAVFENCDLHLAKFDHTILEKADLRTSYNYSINPEVNKIKRAKFSLAGIAGLLDSYDIEIE